MAKSTPSRLLGPVTSHHIKGMTHVATELNKLAPEVHPAVDDEMIATFTAMRRIDAVNWMEPHIAALWKLRGI